MLLEYLNVNSIHILPKAKSWDDISQELLKKVENDPIKEDLQNRLGTMPDSLFGSLGPHILIPHFRSIHIKTPEVFLFIIPKGIHLGERLVHLVLFQMIPETQPLLHLRLLHGLSSLLPQIFDELLNCDTESKVLSVVQRGESEMKPSYKNLNQSQIEFELQTNLQNGLSHSEAKIRLKTFGKNAIENEKSAPIIWKFFKSFFSLFAILLWVATALCFVPGVDMPELVSLFL